MLEDSEAVETKKSNWGLFSENESVFKTVWALGADIILYNIIFYFFIILFHVCKICEGVAHCCELL